MSRTKRVSFVLMLVVVFMLITILGLTLNKNTAMAESRSTSKRPVAFSYSAEERIKIWAMIEWKDETGEYASGTNKTEVDGIYNEACETGTFRMYITDNVTTNADKAYFDGQYIAGNSTTISFDSHFADNYIEVRDSARKVVKYSYGKSVSLTGLAENQVYYVEVSCGSLELDGEGVAYSLTANFRFKTDGQKPIINGASTSTTGKISATDFVVTATDNGGSGLNGLYVKKPNSSVYEKCVDNTYVVNGDSGTYSFYATDNAGNTSSTYYAILDKTKPTGTVKDINGNMVIDKTNKMIAYTATDIGAGLSHLEYKAPNASNWNRYTSGALVGGTVGTYQFRAVDKAGHTSDITSVLWDNVAPEISVNADGRNVENGAKTNGGTLTVSARDTHSGIKAIYVKKPYASSFVEVLNESDFALDGEYEFYCVDECLNESVHFKVIKDNTPPMLNCANAMFGGVTDGEFTVTVTDAMSNCTLYCKTPNGGFEPCGTSKAIGVNDANGVYAFYAVDELGNRSETKMVELKVATPEVNIMTDNNTNTVTITWTGSYTVTLNGKDYIKGTTVTQEGDYTVVAKDSKGLITTKTFSIGHKYTQKTKVEATCTNSGYTEYECITCKGTYRADYITAKGHSYTSSVEKPTCTEGGRVVYTCSGCGYTYEETSGSAFGHQFTEEDIAPTCTEIGGLKHTCTNCGYAYITDRQYALGHLYMNKVVKNATCTECGERHSECERCGNTYDTEIPACGHKYEITETERKDGSVKRTYTCTECKESYTQELGNQYERVTTYIEYLFEQYVPYMGWVLLATSGIWSIVMGVCIITANKQEDKAKAKRMLINYVIGLVAIFAIVVACPYLVKGFAILVS